MENRELKKTNAVRPRGTDSAKVIQVIVTDSLEGTGTADDPCRTQVRYWSLEGELLAESNVTASPKLPLLL